MAAPDHRRAAILPGHAGSSASKPGEILGQDVTRRGQLNPESRIENIRRGQPLVNPPRGRANVGGDVLKECYDVMIRALFDLENLGNRKFTPRANGLSISLGHQAEFGHRLAGEGLNLQPNREFAFLRPNSPHLRARVPWDHPEMLEGTKGLKRSFCCLARGLEFP